MDKLNGFFLSHGDFYSEIPRRGYGRIDQIEEDRILIEVIDADWFDAEEILPGRFDDWVEASVRAPISVIEMMADIKRDAEGEATEIRLEIKGEYRDIRIDMDDPWLALILDENGEDAIYYSNLFAEGRPIAVRNIDELAAEMRARLNSVFSIEEFVATENEIRDALQHLVPPQQVEYVVVYDVGQGSANGLCDGNGMPLAYADIGGGVLGNKSTFDNRLNAMCFTRRPPIILSHWDWDHWSSGMRFPQAQQMVWIVPLQGLGAVHSAFAAMLAGNGKLTVWPPALSFVSVSQVTIRSCNGNGRNHSGLAVEVAGPTGEPPMLLPGDARYNVIPGALATDWHCVVVPHHGADMRNAQVPGSTQTLESRAAYSCGPLNSFQHPKVVTVSNHHVNCWPHTSLGATLGVDRRTDVHRSRSQRLGHLGLSWTASPVSRVTMPCSSRCQLDFDIV